LLFCTQTLLDQLDGLGWEIIDLDNKQHPDDTYRETFTEVVMLAVLREQLKVINPWLGKTTMWRRWSSSLLLAFPAPDLSKTTAMS